MKKPMMIFSLFLAVSGAALTMSFTRSEGETDLSAANSYLREQIYPKLYKVVDYDPKKSFSRCPSGFSHTFDESVSTADMVSGTLYYRQGCSSDVFCEFQLDMASKELAMRNEGDSEYASMHEFISELKHGEEI